MTSMTSIYITIKYVYTDYPMTDALLYNKTILYTSQELMGESKEENTDEPLSGRTITKES